MTTKQDIVDALMSASNNKMDLASLSKMLGVDSLLIQMYISRINHNRKTWPTIQIHRTGKNGASFYELQTNRTNPAVIIHTTDRHTISAVNHVKINHDIDALQIANGQTRAIRMRLVAQTTNRKSVMMQQIQQAV